MFCSPALHVTTEKSLRPNRGKYLEGTHRDTTETRGGLAAKRYITDCGGDFKPDLFGFQTHGSVRAYVDIPSE